MKFVLICHGATASMRSGAFPAKCEPLDAPADVAAARRPAIDRVVTSPDRAAVQTARHLNADPVVVEALRDIDHGTWSGRSFADVHADRPAHLADWLARPWEGTPDGESYAAVCARVDAWIAGVADDGGDLTIVTHPMVVRAILTVTIGLPAEAAMRIDIAPLTRTTLSRHRGWRLQSLGI